MPPTNTQQPPKGTLPSDIQDYKAVPVYRRRWFAVLMMLLFIPALIIIAWTGKGIYAQNQRTKVVYRMSVMQRVAITIISIVIVITNLSTIFSQG